MPFLLTLGKFFLKIFSVLGLGWFVKWQFGNDNADADEEREVWRNFWLKFLLMACFLAALAWFAHYIQLFEMPAVQAALGYAKPILEIIKWPLILATVYGVNWVIWALYFDSRDDKDFMDEWGWLLPFAFFSRNPVLGIDLAAIANALLLWGIYYQLPDSFQQAIVDFFAAEPAKP